MCEQHITRKMEISATFLTLTVCFLLVDGIHARQSPHIVFIAADDLGWNDVGWHNPQMITPNLNKLAYNGVILNSSYVQPVCTPSRNCWMTGMYPYHTGMQHGVIHPSLRHCLPTNLVLLPQKLKELGYTTHIVGKWHLGFCNWNCTPTYRGFDSFMGYYNGAENYFSHTRNWSALPGKIENGFDFRFNTSVYHGKDGIYSAQVIAERAVEIIATNNPETQPLYLYLPFQSVHSPIQVPKRYENMYPNIQTVQRRKYCGMVTALDEAVGNVTAALKKYGYMDNTLIIFTTDNGGPTYIAANNLPLRGAKTTLWEGGTKGAGFVYSKTLLNKTGYLNNAMIHAVDWFPTILHLAGAIPSPSLDGVNQWNTISNNAESARREFVYNIDEIDNTAAIRVGDYKLIKGSPGRFNGWYPLPKEDEDFTDELYFIPKTQLFNIKKDPTEHFDLADELPEVVAELESRLADYKKSLKPAPRQAPDPKSNPKFYNGTWSPGWC